MKRLFTALLLVSLVMATMASPALADKIIKVERKDAPSFLGYAPDRLILVMKPQAGEIKARLSPNAVAVIGDIAFDKISNRFAVSGIIKQFATATTGPLSRYHKVKLEAGTLDEAFEAYSNSPLVEKVEKIGIHSMYATPNDGYYDPYQWYHNQVSDHDIDSPEAWDIQTGADATVVAILDSGTRYYHPDLGGVNASSSNPGASRGNMWINTTELNGSAGVDDDGNGYIDDWIGYDFIDGVSNCWSGEDCNDKDNDPRDFNGHGTHTAGIFGMITNDGYGMAGVAGGWGNGSQAEYGNGVRIMALRMGYSYNYLGQEYGVVMMDAAAEAFYYAADNGAKIASCSWGSSNSGGIGAAVDYFLASGGIVCVAAGNGGAEEAADYLNGRGDCISVGATNETDDGASFTTYGTWVDICAPGDNIYSTYHDHADPDVNYWASLGGTSMATPMVAGVTALIWSQNPSWTASQVTAQLYSSTENIDAYLSSKYIGKMGVGRINSYNAVNTGPQCDLVADFSGSPTSGCAPLSVGFSDLSTGSGIDSWSWTFGDGGTSTSQNPNYTYNSTGTYNVSLTVFSSSQSCDDVVTMNGYITVTGGPTANFSGTPTSGVEPLTVDFTDSSTDATGWVWDFGDGVGTSTAQNPSYTYNLAGTYSVTLTASNACGSDIDTKANYITVNPCVAPVADFSGAPTSGTAPLTVDFTDLSSNGASWSWTFGDGGSSSAQNPSYIYNTAGTYTVALTTSNACGSDLATKVDYVTVTEPQVGKTYANSDISVLGTFSGTFANTTASDGAYEVISESESTSHPVKVTSNAEHKWTFDLGSGGSSLMFYLEAYRPDNSDGDNFIFAYSTDDAVYTNMMTVASGTEQVYSFAPPAGLTGVVYVRVVDSDRSWDLISLDDIFIDEMYFSFESGPVLPVAGFAGTPTSGAAPLSVVFTDLSSGSPETWSWDFGDGAGTSSVQNPGYTYSATGTYTVSLTVTNAQGSDSETKVDYITVSESGGCEMHVHDIVVTRKNAGPNCNGVGTIYIYDASNIAVANATVYATATGPVGGNFSGITGTDGSVIFETGKTKSCSGEWCFEVTNVTHVSCTYNQTANVVTKSCESGPVFKGTNQITQQILPNEFGLFQNTPNPFNPSTEIGFSLPTSSYVRLDVYNLLGQNVAVLADGVYEAGLHSVSWNTTNQASGLYFYRLTAGEYSAQKKMILLK